MSLKTHTHSSSIQHPESTSQLASSPIHQFTNSPVRQITLQTKAPYTWVTTIFHHRPGVPVYWYDSGSFRNRGKPFHSKQRLCLRRHSDYWLIFLLQAFHSKSILPGRYVRRSL